MSLVRSKRICVNLPEQLINRLDWHVDTGDRGELIADLLTEYMDAVEAEDAHVARVEARRERMQMMVEMIRDSGRKAVDMFLP